MNSTLKLLENIKEIYELKEEKRTIENIEKSNKKTEADEAFNETSVISEEENKVFLKENQPEHDEFRIFKDLEWLNSESFSSKSLCQFFFMKLNAIFGFSGVRNLGGRPVLGVKKFFCVSSDSCRNFSVFCS